MCKDLFQGLGFSIYNTLFLYFLINTNHLPLQQNKVWFVISSTLNTGKLVKACSTYLVYVESYFVGCAPQL